MITTGGINYAVAGEGEPGLVFVHGFTCASEDWDAQVAALSPLFRCITLDLPGHGASARPATPTISALASAVNGVRKQIDPASVVLIGHSLGAKVIREAYCQWPDGVAGLILIDGGLNHAANETGVGRIAAAIDRVGFAAYAQEHFAGMFTAHSDPKLRARAMARVAQLDATFGRELYLAAQAWDLVRSRQTLQALAVSVLVLQSSIVGADSKRRPMQPGEQTHFMAAVAELVPSPEAKVISGIGHFTMNETPEEVNRLIREFVMRT